MMIEDEELRNLYKEASADHIQKIEAGLLYLEKNPLEQANLEQLLREMHSLKDERARRRRFSSQPHGASTGASTAASTRLAVSSTSAPTAISSTGGGSPRQGTWTAWAPPACRRAQCRLGHPG
ncbi:MAG: hypothetical protein F6K28_36230 [Microcoleus sp. SIO2G3]|nr:hypothetical protein [Microcoleus sp. SIO2G3]